MRVDRSTRKERVRELMEEYLEAGQPVEAAWVAYCYRYAPEGMPKDQFDDMRETFFAGATFVFSTITDNARQSKGMPTPGQMEYMSEISRELRAYVDQMLPTVGNA